MKKKEVETVINNKNIEKLEINLINPNPNQPRKEFKDEEMLLLANSIYKNGLINPILIYKNENNDYILVAGQLRLAAHKYLNEKYPNDGFNEIEVKISPVINPSESFLLLLAIEENTHRNELDIYQTADSYKKLLELKEKELDKKISIREFSEMVNVSKTMLHDYFKIADLKNQNEELYNSLKENNITSRVAIINIIKSDISNEEKKELIQDYLSNKVTAKEINSKEIVIEDQENENVSFENIPSNDFDDIKDEDDNIDETDNKKEPVKNKNEKVVLGIGDLSEYLNISEDELSNEDDKKIELMLLGLKVILKSKKD